MLLGPQPPFSEKEVLQRLQKHLPHQAPLKDFVHHNTLGNFQEYPFEEAITIASQIFGYKTSLNIEEYRVLYQKHLIREDVLEQVVIRRKGQDKADEWIHQLFHGSFNNGIESRLGHYRNWWEKAYQIDLDQEVSHLLFRLLGGYLDQGVASWKFPINSEGFLASVRQLNASSLSRLTKTKRGQELLNNPDVTITELLFQLVGDEELFENYLFEQQFAHPGWSGLVSVIEHQPNSLIDRRKIKLEDLITLELILEIDAIEHCHGKGWKPLSEQPIARQDYLFADVDPSIESEVIAMWQEAYEWSYFDGVLAGIQKMKGRTHKKENKSFQALFCIDDREGSLRRHIENLDAYCETYGTPGHFGIPMYYQPQNSESYTKVCPGPITPKHLVKEIGYPDQLDSNVHFSKWSTHPILGLPYSLLLGFWSGLMMFFNIFKPSYSSMATSSFSHMGKHSRLSIEFDSENSQVDDLQIGFTITEMTEIVQSVLKSIGLVNDFGSLVYVIGHGSSTINNTHYAGYDCGACSGRPGSVNARVFALMSNNSEVRKALQEVGLEIPLSTQFVAGLHDTTRDEFEFYDEDQLSQKNILHHSTYSITFEKALDKNAKERSRRFFSIDSRQAADKVHQDIRNRSVSLFEPRPELNHSTNSLCLVGRHSLHEKLFLDRRAFSNSYDYTLDPEGKLLLGILQAAVPVSGGINLEYYFSKVDNQKLGSGSKLPHNVNGLIGVTNGIEGDLRSGLPYQMVDLHDPIRLMVVVEHFPEVVLNVIQSDPKLYQWIANEWVLFTVIHPDTYEAYRFINGELVLYTPLKKLLDTIVDVDALAESSEHNLPVYLIQQP